MIRKHIHLLVLLLSTLGCYGQVKTNSFKVMAWNILHGGNDMENGAQNVVKIIREINPDVILMVETYGSGKMIADSLGYNFHLIAPEGTALNDKGVNLSIFSKFPFGERIDINFPFYLGGREILIDNQKIRFFPIGSIICHGKMSLKIWVNRWKNFWNGKKQGQNMKC